MIATIPQENGHIFSYPQVNIVRKVGKKTDTVPRHSHPESYVILTGLSGAIEVCLDSQERHLISPGMLLQFDGTHTIEATFLEDGAFTVTLITK